MNKVKEEICLILRINKVLGSFNLLVDIFLCYLLIVGSCPFYN